MRAMPITQKEANEFVERQHRHHPPAHADKFRVACVADDGHLCGVAQAARPVARYLDDRMTIEVVRCCTDGTYDVCSFLYARLARIAREMGYHRIITYILESESGTSLKACGWHKEADVKGHSWNCKSRPRNTKAPTCDKQHWCKDL